MLEYRARASDFGAWLDRNVNKVGYLIGTRGQVCTQAMIDARLASVSYKPYWDTIPYAVQWIGKVVADCEGLFDMFMNGGEYAKPLTSWPYADTTANGIYSLAVKEGLRTGNISTLPKDWKFPIGIHFDGHVGFFYKGVVYQSIGHRRGFITTDLSEAVNGKHWAEWYEIPYLDYSESGSSGGGGNMVICKRYDDDASTGGSNVKALQTALIRLYGRLVGSNGTVYTSPTTFYGTATSDAVAKLQAESGLAVNGEQYDDKTNAALILRLAALPVSTGITQAMLDAEIAKTVAAHNQLIVANNKLDQVRQAMDVLTSV